MNIYRKPFKYPPGEFQPGQQVKFEWQTYEVLASTHTHSQLKGVEKAIANWRLVKVKQKVNHP